VSGLFANGASLGFIFGHRVATVPGPIRLDQSRCLRKSSTISSVRSPVGIAQFPAAGLVALKGRVNAIALAPVEDFRRDSDLFGEASRNAEAQSRFQTAFNGFQT